jgi:YbbR domain-containing protein
MKKFFLENLGLKIAAVLLSIVLWVFVTSRGQSEMSIDVPLEFNDIPQGLEIVNHTIKAVTLSVKGQERFIKNIRASDIRVSLDLNKAKKGEGVYYIQRDDIKLPRAITVTTMTPSSVKVTLDETITKTVKVIVPVTGALGKAYYVKSVEVTPQTVVIEGTSSEIGRTKNIKTEPLDITGLDETFTQDLRLDLTGKNIRSKTRDVTVNMVIGAKGK